MLSLGRVTCMAFGPCPGPGRKGEGRSASRPELWGRGEGAGEVLRARTAEGGPTDIITESYLPPLTLGKKDRDARAVTSGALCVGCKQTAAARASPASRRPPRVRLEILPLGQAGSTRGRATWELWKGRR